MIDKLLHLIHQDFPLDMKDLPLLEFVSYLQKKEEKQNIRSSVTAMNLVEGEV